MSRFKKDDPPPLIVCFKKDSMVFDFTSPRDIKLQISLPK
ncbi:hypothetical protein A2U01_0073211, partial [Trifolium medium]|nr:hypothetical protein [Trifolium medium]